ncbi:AMP-dependent synthetase [Streptomyces spongiicola]|uniref:AMP-dependent synthetase n=1 Tax=Streptomyces spongiicola TaxID=1690221 RepID=A0A388T485_9ACTN|nr:AMP-binding protein [Streptomyces spongiicola]GBQ02015.1 AMP-dependent synthetase [Streptomyces spongiicola]
MTLHSAPSANGRIPPLAAPPADARILPLADRLATHGDRTALITADGETSYRELAARVAGTAQRLGSERRLVLLPGANTAEALVAYLAALAAGHPVLLVPGDHPDAMESLIAAYDPDVVVRPAPGRWEFEERRAVSAHELHPELALLLSTSGSTGSPKLVRLSHENLRANAESIAEYLGIRDTDRAATTLPLHYCYGLSVVHSHLLRGAGLVLTGLSVADPCFWDLFRGARGTTLAGVPYTFDLLDRVGFADMDLPHLRYVTQAGGRLAPERVAHYAALGARRGWDLFVMYGQTEATARMAYLPPDLAAAHPAAIGVPIPGGAFRIAPVEDHPVAGTGELVYSGPNVMLGYARGPEDLGLGRTVDELRTGDLARRTPEGLYEIVGRRSRFVKLMGLRIDPERVEAMLAGYGITALCTGDDEALAVAAIAPGRRGGTGDRGGPGDGGGPGHSDGSGHDFRQSGGPDDSVDSGGPDDSGAAGELRIRRLIADECDLPARAIRVRVLDELPRLATGKADYPAVLALTRPDRGETPSALSGGDTAADLCALYTQILDRPDVTRDSTFVGLGGDSLTYVEMSIHLEERLGRLPADWHTTPIRELVGQPGQRPPSGRPRSRRRRLETGVALRAAAIFCVVGSHIGVFTIRGGAHLLLAVAGYNFARFHLTDAARRERLGRVGRSIARIALPSMAWIGFALLVSDDYTLSNLFLLHNALRPQDMGPGIHTWFIEALVYILVAVAAVLCLPFADRAERRFPFALPAALTGLGLLTRYDLVGLPHRSQMTDAVTVFWLFALGWAAAKSRTVAQRLLVTAAAVATVPGFFPGEPWREVVVVAGFALLVWLPTLPSRERVNQVAGLVAAGSMYIYLTHWQIYPLVDGFSKHLALLVSLVFGVAYAIAVTRLMRGLPLVPADASLSRLRSLSFLSSLAFAQAPGPARPSARRRFAGLFRAHRSQGARRR